MTDEQIEQHIGMEGGGQHLKMLNENKIKQPNQLTILWRFGVARGVASKNV